MLPALLQTAMTLLVFLRPILLSLLLASLLTLQKIFHKIFTGYSQAERDYLRLAAGYGTLVDRSFNSLIMP